MKERTVAMLLAFVWFASMLIDVFSGNDHSISAMSINLFAAVFLITSAIERANRK